ncbi:MAG: alpha/beta hydrolase [Gammaproteobacteria bacterium]|nr:alpha/beta hydrolase [Gammaproteobacteria bacterium]MBT8109118.1 alpha/beta hydrolase [Gammaproteobacteria bacterium]NNL43821.1 alpha/beta hydrolase [Woeseiaceae bacterium]
MTAIDTVVCVHGFWSHGTGMYLIKRRLEKEFGFRARLFSYRSVRGTLDENAAALARFIHEQEADGVHIIGHSLGGVIALRMLANDPGALPGRVVCLGSPLTGSRAADFLGEQVWAEEIIGRSLPDGVIHRAANDWASHVFEQREIGVIAGNVPLGFGRLFANFREDNDGTIAVSETRFEGATDHLVMPVSHKGMLVSSDVADQAASFLKRGEFLREP